jgi:Flp pilus assembly protein TadB
VALRRVAKLERQLAEALATSERQLSEAQVALRQAASLIAMMAASRPMVESMDEHQRFIVDRVLAGIEKLTAIERSAESLPIRDLRRDEELTDGE